MPDFDFNRNATEYNSTNAEWLAKAAKLAYADGVAVCQEVKAWGFDDRCHPFSQNQTQGFVIGNAEVVILSFRGTEPDNIQDWMTDFRIKLKAVPHLNGRVQTGFYDALGDAYEEIKSVILQFQDNHQTLWVTGHSLGAALATLATARLTFEENMKVAGLYNFGSPRTGDLEFAQAFDAELRGKTFRFVNNNDIVAHVAPEGLYKHVGTLLYLDVNHSLQSDISFWNRVKDQVGGVLKNILDHRDTIKDLVGIIAGGQRENKVREIVKDLIASRPDGVQDHSMDNYVNFLALEQNRNFMR